MTIPGRAFILGGKYPNVVKRSRAKHKALLFQTRDKFIPDITPLTKALIADNKTESIQWYGLWDDGHNFYPGDVDQIIRLAVKFQALKVNSKPLYFAPFLEHETNAEFMRKVMGRLAEEAPKLILVNNPTAKGQYLNDDRFVDELHIGSGMSKPKKRYIVSVDGRAQIARGHGNGSVDMDYRAERAKFPDALIWMDWITQDNGKYGPKDNRKRHERDAWLYEALDESVCFLPTEQGEMFLTKGHIWKSHGEQDAEKPIADPDDNRPAYISAKLKYKKVEIADSEGDVIETVTRSAKYKHGDGYLYRFTRWGYKMAQTAKGKTNSPTCHLICDGEEIGRFNPGFRIPGR